MTPHILIAGGYGVVGAHIARHLRRDHPGVKLTLAGRAPDAGAALAAELDATTARLDVAAPGEGLAAIGPVDLIVAALHDPSDGLIAAAMGMGAGHIGITRTADTISPAAFAAARRATRRPVVPLGHWQAGILTMATLHAAAAFARVDRIALTAVYDMADPIGPLTAGDSEGFSGRALLRENGAWIWAEGGTRPAGSPSTAAKPTPPRSASSICSASRRSQTRPTSASTSPSRPRSPAVPGMARRTTSISTFRAIQPTAGRGTAASSYPPLRARRI